MMREHRASLPITLRAQFSLLRGFVVLAAASQAWGWTMFYDGFAYEPASTDTVNYRLPQTSPCADTVTVEYPYHLGDPRYYAPDNAIPDGSTPALCSATGDRRLKDNTGTGGKNWAPYRYTTAASGGPCPEPHSGVSQWVGSHSSVCGSSPTSYAYWPFIAPGIPGDDPAGFTYTGLPAPTGHVLVTFGSASNSGLVSRVSPVDLQMFPPNNPTAFRIIKHGTLFYSVLVKPRDMTVAGALGNGAFYAGFDNTSPNGTLPRFNTETSSIVETPSLTRACARLKFRASTNANKVQIGLQNDDGGTVSQVYDTAHEYDAGTAVNSPPLLVVVSYTFNPGTDDDVAQMWVNPTSATLGAASPPGVGDVTTYLTTTGADIQNNDIRCFFLRQGPNAGAGNVQRVIFDEVRIGTSWADVTSNVACTPVLASGSSPGAATVNSTAFALSVTGSNFVQGPTYVKLTKSGESDIVAKDVDVTDSGHLTATFDLTGAALGAWSVFVETCVGSPSTLTNAVNVVCGAPADFNCDTFVDGADVVAFETCAPSGSRGCEVPLTPGCEGKDLDGDDDTDVDDFAIVQRCYAGSSVPADPNCAN